MKIIRTVELEDGNVALQLKHNVLPRERATFNKWAESVGIFDYIKFEDFYVVETFGDLDYPAIQVDVNAPEHVVTLCLMKWS